MNLREVVRDWRATRKEVLAVLKKVKGEQWQRIGLHPKRGEFTIGGQADIHVKHDANHLNQIRALRERFVPAQPTREEVRGSKQE